MSNATGTPETAPRFYIVAGSIGLAADEYDNVTGTTDSLRVCGGGWFRTRAAADRRATALYDHGVCFTKVIKAATAAEAIAAKRADDIARLDRLGLLPVSQEA
jgi:hypothetical protein